MVPGRELPAQPLRHLAEALGLFANAGVRGRIRRAFYGPGHRGRVATQPGGFPESEQYQLCLLGLESELRGYRRHPEGRLEVGQPEQARRVERLSMALGTPVLSRMPPNGRVRRTQPLG